MSFTRWSSGNFTLGSDTVGNEQVKSSDPIDVDKLQHLYKPGTSFNLAIDDTPVAREEIVFVAASAGVLRGAHALLNDTGTSTDIDIDVKVNGSTVLSATINITNAEADREVVDGSLTTSPTVLAEGDVVSIELTVTSSTGAEGPWAWVDIQELAA